MLLMGSCIAKTNENEESQVVVPMFQQLGFTTHELASGRFIVSGGLRCSLPEQIVVVLPSPHTILHPFIQISHDPNDNTL